MDEKLLQIADDLRDMLTRLNAYEGEGASRIQSDAYNRVADGLGVILSVLTGRPDVGVLQHTIMLDNPEVPTELCIRMWRVIKYAS